MEGRTGLESPTSGRKCPETQGSGTLKPVSRVYPEPPIPTNDLWIAASTMEHGTELVTLDRDSAHVSQILVALYEQ